jgi:hypothetical protein
MGKLRFGLYKALCNSKIKLFLQYYLSKGSGPYNELILSTFIFSQNASLLHISRIYQLLIYLFSYYHCFKRKEKKTWFINSILFFSLNLLLLKVRIYAL